MEDCIEERYIFNPIKNMLVTTTYEELSELTGRSIDSLISLKCKGLKIPVINSYILGMNVSKDTLHKLYRKEIIKDEEWEDIEGYEGKYMISNYGRIKRLYRTKVKPKLLIPYIRKSCESNWLFVKVTNNKGVTNEVAVHILVANAFLKKPNDNSKEYVVYHKNENKLDNYVSNLMFITRSKLGNITAWKSKGQAVIKVNKITNEIIKEYNSMASAGRDVGIHREMIRLAVINENSTTFAAGYKWIYAKDTIKGKSIALIDEWSFVPKEKQQELIEQGWGRTYSTYKLQKWVKYEKGKITNLDIYRDCNGINHEVKMYSSDGNKIIDSSLEYMLIS